MNRNQLLKTTLVGVVGLSLAACASDPRITTADSSKKVTETQAHVQDTVVGVTLKTEAWSGFPTELGTKVTPIHVRITNRSAEPIFFGYSQMKLVEKDGSVHHALPLFAIEGDVTVVEKFEPAFEHEGFVVMQSYQPMYPDIATTSYSPTIGSAYSYPQQHKRWEVDLPTVSMIAAALPEGVINAGGHISGFVYFEHVGPGAESVSFVYSAHGIESGKPVAEVAVLFLVNEDEGDDKTSMISPE